MPLTDIAIKNAKPKDTSYKLFDEGGLFLEIYPSGSKLWRLKYYFKGKESRISLGKYPAVTLADARQKRLEYKKLLQSNVNPIAYKMTANQLSQDIINNTFEKVALEWFSKFSETWAKSHSSKILIRLKNDVFPWLGEKGIDQIKAKDILAIIERIHSRGALDTAHRVKQNIGQVMRYAVAKGIAERDPTGDLRGALPVPKKNHYPALTNPQDLADFLKSFADFRGSLVVLSALKLTPLLFVRPGELRQMKWENLDLEKAEWKFITSKTKTEHLVPLAMQAVVILKGLNALTGKEEYVFPGLHNKKRPMSEATINSAIRRLGYDTKTQITAHGFRASARTLLAEELGFSPEVIEHQLAHRVPDALGRAYNRTKFLQDRRRMMQAWADYLDKIIS